MTEAERWQLIRGFDLHWRQWPEENPDEYILYHAGSGDTHLLNEAGAQVLKILQGRRLSLEEITTALADQLDEPPGHLHATITELVAELDRLGIIEKAVS